MRRIARLMGYLGLPALAVPALGHACRRETDWRERAPPSPRIGRA